MKLAHIVFAKHLKGSLDTGLSLDTESDFAKATSANNLAKPVLTAHTPLCPANKDS